MFGKISTSIHIIRNETINYIARHSGSEATLMIQPVSEHVWHSSVRVQPTHSWAAESHSQRGGGAAQLQTLPNYQQQQCAKCGTCYQYDRRSYDPRLCEGNRFVSKYYQCEIQVVGLMGFRGFHSFNNFRKIRKANQLSTNLETSTKNVLRARSHTSSKTFQHLEIVQTIWKHVTNLRVSYVSVFFS